MWCGQLLQTPAVPLSYDPELTFPTLSCFWGVYFITATGKETQTVQELRFVLFTHNLVQAAGWLVMNKVLAVSTSVLGLW